MNRRNFIKSFSGIIYASGARALERSSSASIRHGPIELVGDWRDSALADARAVIMRMREACLYDLDLRSDRQPERLRVDDHTSGSPAIWLHREPVSTAWIIVDVGTRDWCKLAYQFGHELGHVIANSWSSDARPGGPSQWLEEALVEAFSLRGLGQLAAAWRTRPPFPNDSAYAQAIIEYRNRTLRAGDNLVLAPPTTELRLWFRTQVEQLEVHGGVDAARPAVPTVLALYEEDSSLMSDLSAMNRWRQRTRVRLAEYLDHWEASCFELNTKGNLPRRLRNILL